MKKMNKWIRPLLFALGGVLLGWGYHKLFGCITGSCVIAASPVNSMVCMGMIGWLLSVVFGESPKDEKKTAKRENI